MKGNSRKFGNEGEGYAVAYLESCGFRIVERNFYARKLGEIDIVAHKAGVVHFIEVKSAKADFDPIYNITPTKMRKIVNSAYYYLKTKKLDMPFCIDVLLVRNGEIEFIENVTL